MSAFLLAFLLFCSVCYVLFRVGVGVCYVIVGVGIIPIVVGKSSPKVCFFVGILTVLFFILV